MRNVVSGELPPSQPRSWPLAVVTRIGAFWSLFGPWRGEEELAVIPSLRRSMACPALPKIRLARIALSTEFAPMMARPGPEFRVITFPATWLPLVKPDGVKLQL